MREFEFELLIAPQKAMIVRRFLPAFRNSKGLRRSPDLNGFLQLAMRRAEADGYDVDAVMAYVETGYLTHSPIT